MKPTFRPIECHHCHVELGSSEKEEKNVVLVCCLFTAAKVWFSQRVRSVRGCIWDQQRRSCNVPLLHIDCLFSSCNVLHEMQSYSITPRFVIDNTIKILKHPSCCLKWTAFASVNGDNEFLESRVSLVYILRFNELNLILSERNWNSVIFVKENDEWRLQVLNVLFTSIIFVRYLNAMHHLADFHIVFSLDSS